jgi:hypothetical protein
MIILRPLVHTVADDGMSRMARPRVLTLVRTESDAAT